MTETHKALVRAEKRIATLESLLGHVKAFHDRDQGCNGFTADYEILRRDIDEALLAAQPAQPLLSSGRTLADATPNHAVQS